MLEWLQMTLHSQCWNPSKPIPQSSFWSPRSIFQYVIWTISWDSCTTGSNMLMLSTKTHPGWSHRCAPDVKLRIHGGLIICDVLSKQLQRTAELSTSCVYYNLSKHRRTARRCWGSCPSCRTACFVAHTSFIIWYDWICSHFTFYALKYSEFLSSPWVCWVTVYGRTVIFYNIITYGNLWWRVREKWRSVRKWLVKGELKRPCSPLHYHTHQMLYDL